MRRGRAHAGVGGTIKELIAAPAPPRGERTPQPCRPTPTHPPAEAGRGRVGEAARGREGWLGGQKEGHDEGERGHDLPESSVKKRARARSSYDGNRQWSGGGGADVDRGRGHVVAPCGCLQRLCHHGAVTYEGWGWTTTVADPGITDGGGEGKGEGRGRPQILDTSMGVFSADATRGDGSRVAVADDFGGQGRGQARARHWSRGGGGHARVTSWRCGYQRDA
jgi:hypothetical protein